MKTKKKTKTAEIPADAGEQLANEVKARGLEHARAQQCAHDLAEREVRISAEIAATEHRLSALRRRSIDESIPEGQIVAERKIAEDFERELAEIRAQRKVADEEVEWRRQILDHTESRLDHYRRAQGIEAFRGPSAEVFAALETVIVAIEKQNAARPTTGGVAFEPIAAVVAVGTREAVRLERGELARIREEYDRALRSQAETQRRRSEQQWEPPQRKLERHELDRLYGDFRFHINTRAEPQEIVDEAAAVRDLQDYDRIVPQLRATDRR